MLSFVALQLAVLLAAAGLFAVEARTGRMEGRSEAATVARALVFLLAGIAGTTLFLALARAEWLFALTLAPITLLSLLRFSMLARRWWPGPWLPVLTSLLLAFGVLLSVPWMPRPLDRTFLIREIHGIETVPTPDTIDPEALRPVRA
jgi:hypothetical protein